MAIEKRKDQAVYKKVNGFEKICTKNCAENYINGIARHGYTWQHHHVQDAFWGDVWSRKEMRKTNSTKDRGNAEIHLWLFTSLCC